MSEHIDNNIVVSICCITYNHAPYIKQCIDGFLMQKTTFPFEIIIHDDASTDGTSDILKEYAQKYPNLIHLIIQKENVYQKNKGILIPYMLPCVKGKYIAICEGDDYWIDPYKLQKQVDFLESHPDFSFCGHAHKVYFQYTNDWLGEPTVRRWYQESNHIIDTNVLFDVWPVITLSIVGRKDAYDYVADQIKSRNYIKPCDVHTFYYLTKCGKGYAFEEKMGVYRVHQGGIFSSIGKRQVNFSMQIQKQLYKNHPDDPAIQMGYLRVFKEKFIDCERISIKERLNDLYTCLKISHRLKDITKSFFFFGFSFLPLRQKRKLISKWIKR